MKYSSLHGLAIDSLKLTLLTKYSLPTISKDTKTYEPLIKDEPEVIETKKEEKKDTYESISLFDFIDDD